MKLITCRVNTMNMAGKGRIMYNGRRVNIPGALAGETVTVEILEDSRNKLTGKILEIVNPSKHRVTPDCPMYPDCPGCSLRHIKPEIQEEMIIQHVHNTITRILSAAYRISHIEFHRIPKNREYRKRCSLIYRYCGTRFVPVMNSAYPDHSPLDLSSCPNHSPDLNRLVCRITNALNKVSLAQPFTGSIREVHFALSDSGPPRVIFVLTEGLTDLQSIEDNLKTLCADTKASILSIRVRSPKTGIQYKEPAILIGEPDVNIRAENRICSVPAGVWSPVSTDSFEMLLEKLEADIHRTETNILIECGCGAGFLSIPLAGFVTHVTGIDKHRRAISSAVVNADRSGINNIAFRTGEAVHALKKLVQSGMKADTLVIHGMRKPFGSQLFDLAKAFQVQNIFVISPSLRAWIHDLENAAARRWRIDRIRIFDQIPQTSGFLYYGHLRPGRLYG